MKNKERLKGFLTGVVITLTASTMLTVFADPIEQAINVVFDDYRIIIDGADKSDTPEDSKPFIYNGRTYVPLRYIGESMGKKVLWDGDTKSIYINDEGNSREDVYFATQGYEKSDRGIYLDGDTNTVSLSGGSGSMDFFDEGIGSIKRAITFNLNGVAKNVLGTVDMSDTKSNELEGKVIFYDQNDKILYQTPTIRNSSTPVELNIPVSGVLQIKAEFIGQFGNDKIDIKIKDFRYSK